MTAPGIRRLSLGELDHEAFEQLARHGEDLLVERKRQPPEPPNFGAAVASFANTLGGWILLGINDDGTIHGWEPPPRADLQSYLGQLLRKEMDPLPPFVAGMRQLDGKPIGVLRIFESADSPHIVRGTGAVYVRTSKGKEPVDDHRTLLELARRGREAEEKARTRMGELPVAARVLRAPGTGYPDTNSDDIRYVIRAAPLTVTPALSQWPRTAPAAALCEQLADELLPAPPMPFTRGVVEVEPYGRAVVARVAAQRDFTVSDHVAVVADSGGVLGVVRRRGGRADDQRTVLLKPALEAEIKPLITAVSTLLEAAEACGRVAIDFWVLSPLGSRILESVRDYSMSELRVAGELRVPVDVDEADELALSWHRELLREVGIQTYEQ